MEKTPEAVSDYMVAVKSEYLVPIKSTRKREVTTDANVNHSEFPKSGTTEDSFANKEVAPLLSTDGDVSILTDAQAIDISETSANGDVPEGYKSNGYKIDDRDRQQSHKKDFTGGKDGHHNNSHGSKKRPRDKDSRPESGDRLCSFISRSIPCPWSGTCEYSHDPLDYLSRKAPDIGLICYQFSIFGDCQSGIMCRYGSHHIDYEIGISLRRSEEDGGVIERVVINPLKKEVQSALRKKKYDFKARTEASITAASSSSVVDKKIEVASQSSASGDEPASKMHKIDETAVTAIDAAASNPPHAEEISHPQLEVAVQTQVEVQVEVPLQEAGLEELKHEEEIPTIIPTTLIPPENATSSLISAAEPASLIPAIFSSQKVEKQNYNLSAYPQKMKLVDFSNKVYIAPLTTVGNLPWRRVMKDFGADITCGEMAMSHNLVMGQASEWARIRRHASEDCFGIQVAGGQPDHMSKIAKLMENETSSDFVDLNCGCPLDTICNRGCGAILLNKPKKLVEIVSAMTKALTSRQVTVKIRTGWDDKNPSAHKLIPMLQKSAKGKIAAIMIHGRSRLQRYSKLANWEYVLQAARSQDPNYPRIPVIGNGDIFSWDDWHSHCDKISSDVIGGNADEDPEIIGLTSCAMLGRGALIKPWLPQELKEKRSIDISAPERLEMLKKFVNYGLEHWGSDTQGVATTRSFLLEWLSFLHRYVPLGLTERQQKMQQRPPQFFGRCDLETLMGSSNSNDWVRISEMLLGPVGDDFMFVAKHKTNSYAAEVEESNG